VERLRETSRIDSYQQQLGKEFEKDKIEQAGEGLTHVDDKWNQLKKE